MTTWQEQLAADLGAQDGHEAVEECLREQGYETVVATLVPGHDGWDEAAINAHAHASHREATLNSDSAEDRRDPFRWTDETKRAYYAAYAAAARARAEEIRTK